MIGPALAVAMLATPILSVAQETAGPVTRAEVLAELALLEKAGYRPGNKSEQYPFDIEAAEARVRAQSHAQKPHDGVGCDRSAGAPSTTAPVR
jgi:Domain of unknown function (DUF4148)